MLLVLSLSVFSSKTQHDYPNWCLIWERLNNLAREIPLFPCLRPALCIFHGQMVIDRSHYFLGIFWWLFNLRNKKEQRKAAKSVCFMWLPTSVTQEKALPPWAVDAWIFSSYVSSKTEQWTYEEASLICHVLPICWRYQCWSFVGMLKCEHFYSAAGYGSCSW